MSRLAHLARRPAHMAVPVSNEQKNREEFEQMVDREESDWEKLTARHRNDDRYPCQLLVEEINGKGAEFVVVWSRAGARRQTWCET